MGKTVKIYIAILVVLIIAMSLSQQNTKREVDWTPSFNQHHKKPWGTYVLYQELQHILSKTTVKTIHRTAYQELHNHYDYNQKSTYLFLNNTISVDKKSIEELLDFTSFGNTTVLIGNNFSSMLKDTLGFETKTAYNPTNTTDKELALYFANTTLNPKKYFYQKGVEQIYFSKLDSTKTTVLGYNNNEGNEKINFIKVRFGDGYFLINTQPYAFTNYHVLKENHAAYVASVLSYIPDYKELLWDSSVKADKGNNSSYLRFIFSQPALAWAWRLGALGLLIFVVFMAKRRQRIIPILKPLENTSIAFAKTIGELYYEEGETQDIVQKKITYFLNFIRERYALDTTKIDAKFADKLHLKSGVPKEEVNHLINLINIIHNKYTNTESDLINLNKLMDSFYKKTN